jgi:hypothetical protein
MKKLLAQEEVMVPSMFFNMRKAFVPLMANETYDAMTKVLNIVEARGRNPSTRAADGSAVRGNKFQQKAQIEAVVPEAVSTSSSASGTGTGSGATLEEDEDGGNSTKRKRTDSVVGDDVDADAETCDPKNPFCAACYELA